MKMEKGREINISKVQQYLSMKMSHETIILYAR